MSKVIVKTEELKRVLESVKNGISKEEYRPVFTGIYIEVEQSILTMTTCDGYKLFTSSCDIVEGEEFKVIVPIFKIPKSAEENITIEVDNGFVTLDFSNEKHTYKIIEGEFLDWKHFFNKESTFKICFNAKYLQDALKGEKETVELQFSDYKSPAFIIGNGRKMVLPVVKPEWEEIKNEK